MASTTPQVYISGPSVLLDNVRLSAATAGQFMDAWVYDAIKTAMSWEARDRADIFNALDINNTLPRDGHIGIPRNNEVVADMARVMSEDWVETGLILTFSRWAVLAIEARTLEENGKELPRVPFVGAYTREIRQDILDYPDLYGVTLDKKIRIPNRPVQEAISMRINPTVLAHLRLAADRAGKDMRAFTEELFISIDGGPTVEANELAAQGAMERVQAKNPKRWEEVQEDKARRAAEAEAAAAAAAEEAARAAAEAAQAADNGEGAEAAEGAEAPTGEAVEPPAEQATEEQAEA